MNVPMRQNEIISTALKARYIRIQFNGFGQLNLYDLIVKGLREICNDNIDNDCDGQLDCQDPDCEPGVVLDYYDLIVCDYLSDIQIPGDIQNCNQCKITWSPSQYLNSAHIQNPTILGSLNILAYEQTYNVTAKSLNGCQNETDVNIINIDDLCISIERLKSSDPCQNNLGPKKITVSSRKPIGKDVFILSAFDLLNNTNLELAYLNDPTMRHTNHEFITPERYNAIPTLNSIEIKLKTNPPFSNCNRSKIFKYDWNHSTYNGGFRIVMPTVVFPECDGINQPNKNDTYGPIVPFSDLESDPVWWRNYGHNATHLRLRIWNRWGNLLHDKSADYGTNGDINIYDIHWDCTYLGDCEPIETYTYILEARNCEFNQEIQCNDCDSGREKQDWCKCTSWAGNFSIIR